MTDATLLRSHVVDDPAEVFERALADRLTGHAVVEPQDAFLLGDDAAARVAFVDGVPVGVSETGGDRTGPAAVETFTGPGPFGVEVYRRRDDGVGGADDRARVPPDLPARRLDDDELAARTRAAAPGDVAAAADPVSAFLDDDDAVESIRAAAREEAVADAEAWGLTDHLADDGGHG